MLPSRKGVMRTTQTLMSGNYNISNEEESTRQVALDLSISLKYAKKQKEFFAEEYAKYDEVLQSVVDLAEELSIDDSMKLSCLFDFLLKNGFFSAYGKHRYFWIADTCPLDIMKGVGVCRHYSAMLVDLMTKANYQSADIFCKLDPIGPDVHQDHAVTLIKDDGELYIFDATNSEFFKILSAKKASAVSALVSLIIDIKSSLLYPRTLDEADLLYDYSEEQLPNKNLNARTVYAIEGQTREAIKANMDLIQDFYGAIYPNLKGIVEGVARKREKK